MIWCGQGSYGRIVTSHPALEGTFCGSNNWFPFLPRNLHIFAQVFFRALCAVDRVRRSAGPKAARLRSRATSSARATGGQLRTRTTPFLPVLSPRNHPLPLHHHSLPLHDHPLPLHHHPVPVPALSRTGGTSGGHRSGMACTSRGGRACQISANVGGVACTDR